MQTGSFSSAARVKKHSCATDIVTPELSAATERTKVIDQNATYILATAAKSLGYDPQELIVNKRVSKTDLQTPS